MPMQNERMLVHDGVALVLGGTALIQMSFTLIQQVLRFFSELEGIGTMLTVPAVQNLGVQHAAVVAPRIKEMSRSDIFLRQVVGPLMTGDEHDLFYKFIKMNPSILYVIESEDAYEYIINCHERLYRMGVVEWYGVELITFQFQGDSKIW